MSGGRLQSVWRALAFAVGMASISSPLSVAQDTEMDTVDLPLAESSTVTPVQKRLMRSALRGNIWGLQSLVRGAFHEGWPAYKGTLVFLPYDTTFHNAFTLNEFAEELLTQFRASAMWASLSHLSLSEQEKVEAYIRNDAAKIIYDAEEQRQAGKLRLGHTRSWTLHLPVETADGTEPNFTVTLLRLEMPCLPCLAKITQADGTQCQALHPDTLYLHQSDHVRVTFHELAHVVAALRGDQGSAYSTPTEQNLEEVRANIFGALVGVLVFGMEYADEFAVAADRTAQSHRPSAYFNPQAYRAAEEWVRQTGYPALSQMSLVALYEQSDALAQRHALTADEADALVRFVAATTKDTTSDIQKRLARAEETPEPVTGVLVNQQILAYPPVVQSYDHARLQLRSGNPALAAMLFRNPLRPKDLQVRTPFTFERSSTTEVAGYNAFNAKLFGQSACVVQVEPRSPAPSLVARISP